jgi:hypothetical protein
VQHLEFCLGKVLGRAARLRPAGRTRIRCRLMCGAAIAVAFLCPRVARPAYGQGMPTRIELRASPQGELATFWQVLQADVREKFPETMGYLELKNVTTRTLTGGVVYAEYFDAAGRFCFSLLFSQGRNTRMKRGAAPGETVVAYSGSGGFFPALEPREVRLYLVQQSVAGEPGPPLKWSVPFRVPVTLDGGIGADAGKIQLGPGFGLGQGPVVDLASVRVTVDQDGFVDGAEVLGAADAEAGAWLLNFVHQLTFYPATDGDLPETADALLVVRVVLSEGPRWRQPPPPRASPWIRSYAARVRGGGAVPPVTQVVFARPARRAKLNGSDGWTTLPPAPPGVFEVNALGSYWSDLPTNLVRDPSMAHHWRTVLVLPDARR